VLSLIRGKVLAGYGVDLWLTVRTEASLCSRYGFLPVQYIRCVAPSMGRMDS
jgi:hypothetical protein